MGAEGDFNRDRAELFEALGHPTRIRILQALSRSPLGFSDLKRETEIESNGLLSFHLNKLDGLVKIAEGSYTLTDEGREAMRAVLQTGHTEDAKKRKMTRARLTVMALALSLMAIIVLAGALYYTIGSLQLYAAVDQVQFSEARLTNFAISQDPKDHESAIAFSYQVYCTNPQDSYIQIILQKVSMYIPVSVDHGQSSHLSGFLLEDENDQMIDVAPHSTVEISGTAFFAPSTELLTPLMVYLSTNGSKIQDMHMNMIFSSGTPFLAVSKTVRPTIDPAQYTFFIYAPAIAIEDAISIGREFLDSRNYTTGEVSSVYIRALEPNNYWHSIFGISNDAQPGFQYCWAISFEEACCPGYCFVVWVNSDTGKVIGGSQTL